MTRHRPRVMPLPHRQEPTEDVALAWEICNHVYNGEGCRCLHSGHPSACNNMESAARGARRLVKEQEGQAHK